MKGRMDGLVAEDHKLDVDRHRTPGSLASVRNLEHQKLLGRMLGRYSGVAVLIVMVSGFSIAIPRLFLSTATLWEILNTDAITAIAALILVVPLAAGVFDISVPYTMTLSGVATTYLIVFANVSVWLSIVIGIGVSVAVGVMNGLVVVWGKIDSLIGTLATGFVIQALADWISRTQIISGSRLTGLFQELSFLSIFRTIELPVVYAAGIATVLWYLFQHTALGRRVYATGFRPQAARLATIRVDRIRFGALIVSATLAGVAGIVLASNLGSGSPTAGNDYLLPAFAGVFLGSTQVVPGRFNAWGTVLAVLLLGTLATGLGLADVPLWAQQLADGLVLIVALAIHAHQQQTQGTGPGGIVWGRILIRRKCLDPVKER